MVSIADGRIVRLKLLRRADMVARICPRELFAYIRICLDSRERGSERERERERERELGPCVLRTERRGWIDARGRSACASESEEERSRGGSASRQSGCTRILRRGKAGECVRRATAKLKSRQNESLELHSCRLFASRLARERVLLVRVFRIIVIVPCAITRRQSFERYSTWPLSRFSY